LIKFYFSDKFNSKLHNWSYFFGALAEAELAFADFFGAALGGLTAFLTAAALGAA
jgi:DUF971 family protein